MIHLPAIAEIGLRGPVRRMADLSERALAAAYWTGAGHALGVVALIVLAVFAVRWFLRRDSES